MPDPQDQNIEPTAEEIFRDLASEAPIRPIGDHLLVHEFPEGALTDLQAPKAIQERINAFLAIDSIVDIPKFRDVIELLGAQARNVPGISRIENRGIVGIDPELPYQGYYILQCLRSAYDEMIIKSLTLHLEGWAPQDGSNVTLEDIHRMQDSYVNVVRNGSAPPDDYMMNVMIPPNTSLHFDQKCFSELKALVSSYEPSSANGMHLYQPLCIEYKIEEAKELCKISCNNTDFIKRPVTTWSKEHRDYSPQEPDQDDLKILFDLEAKNQGVTITNKGPGYVAICFRPEDYLDF